MFFDLSNKGTYAESRVKFNKIKLKVTLLISTGNILKIVFVFV